MLLALGEPMEMPGPELSTVKVPLGPADGAVFPAVSDAVPAAIDIPKDPFPVILLMVTVLVLLPLPLTETVPLAVPVVFRVTFPVPKVTDEAPV